MSKINVFTKQEFDSDFSNLDLCFGMDINPIVKSLYYKYQNDCNKFAYDITRGEHGEKKYYVYAWHTIQLPKRYFYVGKGTKDRYKHILKEIKEYKSGEKKNNTRYKQYSLIQEHCGIECEFVLSNVSEYEALIFEQCVKLELWNRGEVLLVVEGVVDDNKLPDGWRNRETSPVPVIEKDPFIRRYINADEPFFDTVDIDKLKQTYIYFGNVDEKDSEKIKLENKYIERC